MSDIFLDELFLFGPSLVYGVVPLSCCLSQDQQMKPSNLTKAFSRCRMLEISGLSFGGHPG